MNIYIRKPGIDQPVVYGGHTLPLPGGGKYLPPMPDLTNNPSLVILGGIKLPIDVAVYISGEKTIAESKILDGVSVFEHVARLPYEIEFEMVIRTKNDQPGLYQDMGYIFPQKDLEAIWDVWLLDSVVSIENTYLNGLYIDEMIIKSITPTTIRGSKNLPLRIKGYENIKGQSIIIT
jgi:hypothetical protein